MSTMRQNETTCYFFVALAMFPIAVPVLPQTGAPYKVYAYVPDDATETLLIRGVSCAYLEARRKAQMGRNPD